MTGRVLLLNATFEPLALVTERRAVILLLSGRAEAIAQHEHPPVVHAPSLEVTIPAIVRLSHMVAAPRRMRTPPPTRRGVLRRDGGRCAYCSGSADTIDHVIPKSRGGEHSWTNLVAACKQDNLKKGDRLLSELGWSLPFTPKAPHARSSVLRHLIEVDPLWEPYLANAS